MIGNATPIPVLSADGIACSHCALEVPPGLVQEGAPEQFCCAGCRAAWGVIHSCGLADYYRLLKDAGDRAPQGPTRDHRFSEFDDEGFRSRYVENLPSGLAAIELVVDGVHCGACLWLLEKLPEIVPGVVQARLALRAGLLWVTFDPSAVQLSMIASAMHTLGYSPHPAKDRDARQRVKNEDRRALVRIAVAGACAGNVMMLAFALYGGAFDEMDPAWHVAFRWLSAAIGGLSLVWPAAGFFRSAWASVRSRTPNIDVPICIALLAGGVAGVVNAGFSRGELYFDSLTMLVLLLLSGRFIGRRQQRWAADAVELLYAVTPFHARQVVEDDSTRDVPAESLAAGDVVEVYAGESFPVDGVVETGGSEVDLALLSGESRPAKVGPGDVVLAGTVNLSSVLRVRASATGASTRAGRLMALVSEGAARRSPLIRFVDSIAIYFVVVVLGLAALTFLWWIPASLDAAIDYSIAMLIVTCPCALGLAAPVAIGVSIGRASRDGVLIKGGDALEALSKPGVLVLDKTGTITQGKTRVVRAWGSESAIRLAGALESCVHHPVAAAIRDFAPHIEALPTAFQHTVGGGVRGVVDGHKVCVGSEAFVSDCIGSSVFGEYFAEAREAGYSAVGVVVDGALHAVLGLGDRMREDAPGAIESMRVMGWRVMILSGDDPEIVRRVGSTLGIEPGSCMGGVTPEQKKAFIETLVRERTDRGSGSVAMVGDGVNDAAALACADVGIAVQGGAEASLAAADVYIARPGLGHLTRLLMSGPRTLATIHLILAVSLLYNLIAGTLTFLGVIHPIIAAALMPISSLSVLWVAVRRRSWVGAEPVRGSVRKVSRMANATRAEVATCP
jgi:Cu2+-exporting ATPase